MTYILIWRNQGLDGEHATPLALFQHGISDEERAYWEAAAAAEKACFEREKREHNDMIPLDEELKTDFKLMMGCECGNPICIDEREIQRRRCEQLWSRYRHDHRGFNEVVKPSENLTGPRQFHPFPRLPREIQDEIYTYIFDGYGEQKVLRQWQLLYESTWNCHLGFCQLTHLQPLDTRILAVNRQTYQNGLEILYSCKTFVVDVYFTSTLPLFIGQATRGEAPRPSFRIKRWKINISFKSKDEADFIVPQLENIRDVMKDCVRLKEVHFTGISPISVESTQNASNLVGEYNRLLEIFTTLRGVDKVIFTKPSDAWKHRSFVPKGGNIIRGDKAFLQSVKARMESQQ